MGKKKDNPGQQKNGMEPFGTHGPGTSRPLSQHPNFVNKDPNIKPYVPPGQLQTFIITPTRKKK